MILVPEETVRGKARKAGAFAVIVFFSATLVGTLTVDTLWPAPVPKLQGQEKKAEDALRAEANWSDGSKFRIVERDLRLTSRTRRNLVAYYAAWLFMNLGEAKSEARVGRDGWVYLGERVDLLNRPAGETVLPAISMMSAVNRRFASQGAKLLVAPIPRKSEVYPQHLPRNFDPRRDFYPLLIDGLRQNGVRTADLRTAFERVTDRVLYYVYDSHWNDDGQIVAAEELTKAAGLWKPADERDTEVKFLDMKADPGDLVKMIGIDADSGALDLIPKQQSKRFDIKWPGKGGKLLAKANESKEPPSMAISGTSFTANTRFPKYLRHFTNRGVEVHAWPGAGSVEPLRRLVSTYVRGRDAAESLPVEPRGTESRAPESRRAGHLPEWVVWETQLHDILCVQFPLRYVGNVFAELAPKTVTPLAQLAPGEPALAFAKTSPLKVGKYSITNRSLTGWIEDGAAAFAPDGAVALRLRGNVSVKPIDVVISTETISYTTQWKPGQADVVLPILCTRQDGKLRVAIRVDSGEAGLNLKGVDFVADVDPATRALATVSADQPGRQTLRFDRALPDGRHRLLVIRTETAGTRVPESFTVTCDGPNGQPLSFAVKNILSGAPILVGIPASAPPIQQVVVDGAGGVARRVASAAIYSQ